MRALEDNELQLPEIFANAKLAKAEAEDTLKEITPRLLDALTEEPNEIYPMEQYGHYMTIVRKKVWAYDDDVQEQIDSIEAEIKDLKGMVKDLQTQAQQQAQARVVASNAQLHFKRIPKGGLKV